jgi:phage terminase small subunit
MALRGRKPKSLAEKRLTGNPGKRPLRPVVPEPPTDGALLCPVAVRDDPRAAAYWDLFLASTAPGHLTSVDAPLLARLCVALVLADAATAQVRTVGLLVKAPHTGLPIQSPWVAVMNRQTEIARKLAAELALPPAQRGRVWAGPPAGAVPAPDDEWPF